MTTSELLEFASLDALGLLDDQERLAYEKAFRAAPPHVQAMVRKEQSRFAQVDSWLPNVEPPATLRARVINAIHEAMLGLAPHDSSDTSGGVIGKIGPALRTSPALWRAASIGFATASLVLGSFFYFAMQENQKLAMHNSLGASLDYARIELGSAFERVVFSQNKHEFEFTLAPEARGVNDLLAKARVRLAIDADTGTAILYTDGLLPNGEYRLIVQNEGSDRPDRIEEFQASDQFSPRVVQGINLDMIDNMAIVGPRENTTDADTVLFSKPTRV